MATLYTNNFANIESSDSGITGVTAVKSGNVVELYFLMSTVTAEKAAYNLLGTLNSKYWPYQTFATTIIDNSASTRDKMPVFITVGGSGLIYWYATSATDSFSPRGLIRYFAKDTSV